MSTSCTVHQFRPIPPPAGPFCQYSRLIGHTTPILMHIHTTGTSFDLNGYTGISMFRFQNPPFPLYTQGNITNFWIHSLLSQSVHGIMFSWSHSSCWFSWLACKTFWIVLTNHCCVRPNCLALPHVPTHYQWSCLKCTRNEPKTHENRTQYIVRREITSMSFVLVVDKERQGQTRFRVSLT